MSTVYFMMICVFHVIVVKGVGPVWCLLCRSPRPAAYSHRLRIRGSSISKGFSTSWLHRGTS